VGTKTKQMERILRNFGHLITDSFATSHGERTFQICAQQEIPEEVSAIFHKTEFTKIPDALKKYFHWQDIEVAEKWVSGGPGTFDRPAWTD